MKLMDGLTKLLLEAQAGDRAALERFIAATHTDVLSLCRYLGDPDNYDDLAQETYERAIGSLHRYRATGPAKHWLLTIARRTCIDATRRRSRRRKLQQRLTHQHPVLATTEPPIGLSSELDELILQLNPDRRAAFVLTQINGLRYDEAATVLDVPIGTIRSRVSRSREQLVAALETAEISDRDAEPETLRRRPGL